MNSLKTRLWLLCMLLLALNSFAQAQTPLGIPPTDKAAYQQWYKQILNSLKNPAFQIADAQILTPAQARQKDSLALVALYNATAGNQWLRKTNWLSGKLDTWQGVTVENGRVALLDLNNNRLTGTLPAAFGDLSLLRSLNLSFNSLSGSLPASFYNLSVLQGLLLTQNRLEQVLPATFRQLTSLVFVEISGNRFSGSLSNAMSGMTKLGYILATGNQFTGNIDFLNALTNLVTIELGNNQLSGTVGAELSGLTKLQGLYLYGNSGLEGTLLTYLPTLTDLREAVVNDCRFSGNMPEGIGNLGKLYRFELNNNLFSGTLPTSLTQLLLLQNFQVAFNGFTGDLPSGMSALNKLTFLYLINNNFTSLSDLQANPNKANMTLYAVGNQLDFGDLEPFFNAQGQHPFAAFTYAPQQKSKLQWSGYILNASVGGSYSRYQWRRNNGDIAGAAQSQYIFNNDRAWYDCVITNTRVPLLTLISETRSELGDSYDLPNYVTDKLYLRDDITRTRRDEARQILMRDGHFIFEGFLLEDKPTDVYNADKSRRYYSAKVQITRIFRQKTNLVSGTVYVTYSRYTPTKEVSVSHPEWSPGFDPTPGGLMVFFCDPIRFDPYEKYEPTTLGAGQTADNPVPLHLNEIVVYNRTDLFKDTFLGPKSKLLPSKEAFFEYLQQFGGVSVPPALSQAELDKLLPPAPAVKVMPTGKIYTQAQMDSMNRAFQIRIDRYKGISDSARKARDSQPTIIPKSGVCGLSQPGKR
jgi:Leucine-rich repeat (LRR) protein